MGAVKRLFEEVQAYYDEGYTRDEIINLTGIPADWVDNSIEMLDEANKYLQSN